MVLFEFKVAKVASGIMEQSAKVIVCEDTPKGARS